MSFFNESNKENIKKRAVFRYFETIGTNFSKLILVNLAYFACILPMFCGAVYLFCVLFISPESELIRLGSFIQMTLYVLNAILSRAPWASYVFIALFVVSCIAYGPLTAGLTYCTRNIVQRRHVFVSDLFSQAKSNFKQGLVLGLLDIVFASGFALYLVADFSSISGNMLYIYQAMKILAIIFCVIYICVRFYSYTIAVTFELRISDIIKNSLIFCVLGFFKNLLAYVLGALIILTFISTPQVDFALIATLLFSLCRFSVQFATYSVIEKYMLKKAEKDEEK